ncbi:transcriptional regulator, HxlR family [Rhizobiales bacterium GAS113]|nr:transcriptional regulator, HxlR family [Rhizobiales bacterium GAS113]SEE77518.1 transcriptional regulator, HxlR family [Rhizobiales bacterium GAS188]
MTISCAQGGTFLIRGHMHVSEDCRRVSTILSRVGDKWTVLVVALLGAGPKRFNEIKRLVGGISQRMLTLTLRGLERDGLVTRTVFPTIPPRVDYELTELGRSLLPPVAALGDWARANGAAIDAARERFDHSAGA